MQMESKPILPSGNGQIHFANIEMEKAVIGCVVRNPTLLADCSMLEAEDFYNAYYANIFYCLVQMDKQREEITLFTVTAFMRKLGSDFSVLSKEIDTKSLIIEAVQDSMSVPETIAEYSRQIKELSSSRKAFVLLQEFQSGLLEREGTDFTVHANKLLADLENLAASNVKTDTEYSGNDLIDLGISNFINREDLAEDETLCQTGIENLDELLNSFREGTLNIIAARPAMGKTVFATQIADRVAERLSAKEKEEGRTIAVFSLEMLEDQMAERKLASVTGISLNTLQNESLKTMPQLVGKLHEAYHNREVGKFIRYDFDFAATTRTIRAKCRSWERYYGKIKVIVVDYLQLINEIPQGTGRNNFNSVELLSFLTREFKRIAKEFRCPVILLSQLNREVESRVNKRPKLADLRGSGSIEQDADTVLFLYRDNYYNPESGSEYTEINLAKNRNGKTDVAFARFKGEISRFEDLNEFELQDAVSERRAALAMMQDVSPVGNRRFSNEEEF